MNIIDTTILGVHIVDVQEHADERGSFARTFDARLFAQAGLRSVVVQANVSTNRRAGTLRGMHFQRPPHAEAKLVRCTRGAVYDVAVDLRPSSPTFLEHVGVALDAVGKRALYVPEGCAHGYLTLTDDAEVAYQVSAAYAPASEGGVRWDDPALAIAWPRSVEVVSPKDAAWPLIDRARWAFDGPFAEDRS
jgi:dTDP-4-dehydrorhamnose 3,5-epimerase